MNEIYELRLHNMHKKSQSQSPCQVLYSYLKQHFNPKKLPHLVTHLISNHIAEKTSCSKTNNISLSLPILNTPSISVMFTNMKLYDDRKIIRENAVLEKMLAIRQKWEQFCGLVSQNKIKEAEANQRETACTFGNHKTTQRSSKNQKNKRKTTQFQVKIQLNLLQILQLSYTAFDILDYRLKDLSTFITTLSELLMGKEHSKTLQAQLKNSIYQLYHICQIVLNQIDRLKVNIESCTGAFMDYRDQFIVQGKNVCYVVSYFALKMEKERARRLYIAKNYAVFYRDKLKQINQRYTKMAKQIFAQQIIQKKKKTYRINNVKTEQTQYACFDLKSSQANHFYSEFPCLEETERNIGSNIMSLRKNHDRHSILKNKNGFSKKQKRISIQILTSLWQEQRKSRHKNQNGQNSKFMQRPAITIGSKRKLTKKMIQGKSQKGVKKQVRIEQFENHREKTKQKKIYNKSKNVSPSASPKSKNEIKIITKKTNLEIFEELCQKLDKQQRQSQQCSIISKLQHNSWHQKNAYETPNRSSLTLQSKTQISKCRTEMNPTQSKKMLIKFQEYLRERRSFLSCRDLRKYRGKKQERNLSDSFMEILDNALEGKIRRRRMKEGGEVCRSGRIIVVGSEDYEDIMDKLDIVKKRNNDSKTKTIKERVRLGKTKYNQMFQEGTTKPKQEQPQVIQQCVRPIVEHKTLKRLELRNESELEVKTMSLREPEIESKSIRRTMGSTGSRKYPLSNKKLHNEESQPSQKQYWRIKTEQNYYIPPQFKVNAQQKQNISKTFVNFYPEIECSLYKIAKRQQRLGLLESQKDQKNNKMLEFLPVEPKRQAKQEQSVGQVDRGIFKKREFLEENVQFRMSRDMLASASLLHQKELCSLGK